MRTPSRSVIRFVLKPLLWATLLAPAVWLGLGVLRATQGDPSMLGADPAETIVHVSGETAIRALIATLLVGVLKDVFRIAWILQVRRLLGLWTFAWGTLHLTSYAVLELGGSMDRLLEDFVERPYILAGGTALVAMLPLALTSTAGWRRRLGPRWKRLHRLVWVAALAASVHLVWQARADLGEAVLYAAAFAAIAVQRVWFRWPAIGTQGRPTRQTGMGRRETAVES